MFYRLRQAIQYSHFKHATRALRDSPPLPCDPEASCAIHTMLSAHDMPLYLVAIKSLLRFYRSVQVVVHSDGSLNASSEALLRHHVPGCKIVGAEEADTRAREAMDAESDLFKLRALDASWRRIVDTELWNSTASRIIMDSDILVLQRPDELIEWIEHGELPRLVGQPPIQETVKSDSPRSTAPVHMQTVFKSELAPLSAAMGLPNKFLDGCTSGFYCCRSELTLDRVERVFRTAEQLNIPMREWGGEQCLVIYLLSVAGGDRFDPDRYVNFDPAYAGAMEKVVLAHFYGTYRFYDNVYPKLASEIARGLGRTMVAAS
jgi:hypothetical protein